MCAGFFVAPAVRQYPGTVPAPCRSRPTRRYGATGQKGRAAQPSAKNNATDNALYYGILKTIIHEKNKKMPALP
jgi:hypothetical protein